MIYYSFSVRHTNISYFLHFKNNGDTSYPSQVPVFKQGLLDEQIDQACSRFLMEQIKIDKKKRIVFLPKVSQSSPSVAVQIDVFT